MHTSGKVNQLKMDMDKVKKYAPYVFVGSLFAWLWIYSCLSLHYSSNIATYHQKLSTDLRKIRKQYMSRFYESEEELRVVSGEGWGAHRCTNRLSDPPKLYPAWQTGVFKEETQIYSHKFSCSLV